MDISGLCSWTKKSVCLLGMNHELNFADVEFNVPLRFLQHFDMCVGLLEIRFGLEF